MVHLRHRRNLVNPACRLSFGEYCPGKAAYQALGWGWGGQQRTGQPLLGALRPAQAQQQQRDSYMHLPRSYSCSSNVFVPGDPPSRTELLCGHEFIPFITTTVLWEGTHPHFTEKAIRPALEALGGVGRGTELPGCLSPATVQTVTSVTTPVPDTTKSPRPYSHPPLAPGFQAPTPSGPCTQNPHPGSSLDFTFCDPQLRTPNPNLPPPPPAPQLTHSQTASTHSLWTLTQKHHPGSSPHLDPNPDLDPLLRTLTLTCTLDTPRALPTLDTEPQHRPRTETLVLHRDRRRQARTPGPWSRV